MSNDVKQVVQYNIQICKLLLYRACEVSSLALVNANLIKKLHSFEWKTSELIIGQAIQRKINNIG